jgi:S-methylmethionine-dependent homocysteine/selenocysteine methylase
MPSRNSRGGGESFADALGTGRLVLDGGLATELEARGYDLSGELWSAGLLAAEPAAIVDVHLAYYRAGARVATTASYQASVDGFARAGVDRLEAETLIARSVELAAAARDRAESDVPLFVAASVGPYGATLADGSEYTGTYDLDVAGLRRFHRPRLELLASAGADVLAIETLPCLAEVEAVLSELDRLGGVSAWLSLTCADGRTRRGEDAAEAFAMARDAPSVVAVGLNCTAPDEIETLIPMAAGADRPVLVYPNSGEGWDARRRVWTGNGGFTVDQVRRWAAAGVAAVGGCCRVGPDAIEQIARVLDPDADPG